ncbi:hypothetical protein D9756_007939 [Leucocoprinus leucothites]|uniref:Meiotically up-regulated gene 152 protein n=1 Tax=Leucocoprinus leucothites TaxID=201217 RepID=A0A8H5D668_9AGAR|nr:hypothetical protein D9756_007939 [Leucoagaricus leucothites]
MAALPSADSAFATPFSALKQRRVSLALPASTPRVPWDFRDDTGIAGPSNAPQQQDTQSATESTSKEPKKGKIRKTEPQDPTAPLPEKKPRKKWSPEETQMLVEGCNRHGVGNWKTILSDPTLKFDNRSPVDLKDRFRTYFPDAYKKHYPNARTHLSSKIRSTLPDGSSLFEKTRSKRRRPFTEEEDRALKAGYEKHGTVWATIVKDPIFQEQNRRSTDLRDRFRNAFPELYQAAGYKPRNNLSKKKKEHLIDDSRIPGRAATDDQLPVSSSGTTGPVRGVRRRRAQTSQGILLRGGTKSVPQSTAPSEDEDSSPEDTDGDLGLTTKAQRVPKMPVLADQPSMTDGMKNLQIFSPTTTVEATFSTIIDDDDEMDMRLITLEPLSDPLADYPSSSIAPDNHTRVSRHTGIHTPIHAHHPSWTSPQPVSHNTVDDGGGGGSNPPRSSTTVNNNTHAHAQIQTSAPTTQQPGDNGTKVGQSAWGPQDWLSPNPRLDPSFNSPTNANPSGNTTTNTNVNAAPATGNSTPGTGTPSSYFSPSSPFTSFNLTPLHTTNPLSPSTTTATTTAGNVGPTSSSGGNSAAQNATTGSATAASANPNSLVGLTTLNLPMNLMGNYNSHQHHHVIERYDLWPPALALSSSFSAVNNSSAWSSGLSGSGGGPFSGPGSLSAFSSSFGGDFESEVSFDTHSQTFSDDQDHEDAVFGSDGAYSMGYATGNGGAFPVSRAITHHSDYAGDLIFGARGYGLGGGFGWFGSAQNVVGTSVADIDDPHSASTDGTMATGLGLVGITKDGKEASEGVRREGSGDHGAVVVPGDGKGSINPMQLHASSSGIDEVRIAGITLNDSQEIVDVDEEMSDAAMDGDDDAMDGTGLSANRSGDDGSGPSSAKTPSPEKQQHRQNVVGGGKSNSADASPVQARLGHISLSPQHHHSQQQHLHPLHLQHHANTTPHTPAHNGHSLSLSLGPSTAFSPSSTSLSTPGINTYGRFSLDDLDLVDLTQQQNALVDMNNLTPPATPMMQHATQLRGGRRYGAFNSGLGGNGGLGLGGGSLFMQGPGQGQTGQQEQAQAARSISVPPSEVRNANSSPVISFAPAPEAVERGRPKVVDTMHTVKRSLSSTVHHSHGPGTSHGHSLSLSTLPPLPPHSEIWRSTTPIAKTSSSASSTSTGNSAQSASSSSTPSTAGASTTPGATASQFGSLFPSPSSSPSPFGSSASGTGGDMTSTGTGIGINPDAYTNSDLPFLDLHYNLGQYPNPQQLQQSFGTMAMLIDTPATTPGIPQSSTTNVNNGVQGMTQAELEARQALDLAQPFYFHHASGNAHAQALHHLGLHSLVPNQTQQGSGFGFPNNGTGLKAHNGGGNAFNTPLNLSRQFPQFSSAAALARTQQQQQQQLGHQRVQSQQVVNPKDLVLNANGAGAVGVSGGSGGVSASASGSSGMGIDNRRKRASWDGGMV